MAQLKVRDVMTTQVITLKGTDTIKQATVKLAVENVSSVPVLDPNKKLIGMLSETDILKLVLRFQAAMNVDDHSLHTLTVPMDDESVDDEKVREVSKKISETLVQDIMSETLLTTSPNERIIEVVKAMIEKKVNKMPVLEKGVLVGIISRSDIIFSIYKKKV